jgi:hypothetical protein
VEVQEKLAKINQGDVGENESTVGNLFINLIQRD